MEATNVSRSPLHLGVSSARLTSLAAFAALAAAMSLTTACNSVTGAGDLRLVDPDDLGEETDGEGSSGETNGSGGSTGSGNPTACIYPTENIGEEVGQVMKSALSWDGYIEGTKAETEISKVTIENYLDCDGTKEINALLVLTSATWCGVCDGEASQLNYNMDNGWKEMGIRVLTLMIEDVSSNPATTKTAYEWKVDPDHDLMSTAVAADPTFSLAPSAGGSIGLPLMHVIDPRTMEIVHIQQGSSGSFPELEALAQKNASAMTP